LAIARLEVIGKSVQSTRIFTESQFIPFEMNDFTCCQFRDLSLSVEYYIVIPIDDSIVTCYRTYETANVRLQKTNLPTKSSGEFQLRFTLRAWIAFSAPIALGNFVTRFQVVLICPHLAANESHPLANLVRRRSGSA
jgi:hypothetical protein